MLAEFIDFADERDYHKRFVIYNLALHHHQFTKIIAFKNVIFRDFIINKFTADVPYYLSEEIVYQEYYDFCYYYKYHSNIEEFNKFLKFIMDTINNFETKRIILKN